MPWSDEPDFPGDSGPPSEPAGKDKLFLVVLIVLVALAAILWLLDPAHQRGGKSRADWPPAHAKP